MFIETLQTKEAGNQHKGHQWPLFQGVKNVKRKPVLNHPTQWDCRLQFLRYLNGASHLGPWGRWGHRTVF